MCKIVKLAFNARYKDRVAFHFLHLAPVIMRRIQLQFWLTGHSPKMRQNADTRAGFIMLAAALVLTKCSPVFFL